MDERSRPCFLKNEMSNISFVTPININKRNEKRIKNVSKLT